MGLDPNAFANMHIALELKQEMFRMTKKLDEVVHVAGRRRLRPGIDSPSPNMYERKSRVAVLQALVP